MMRFIHIVACALLACLVVPGVSQAELVNIAAGTDASASSTHNAGFPPGEAVNEVTGVDLDMWHSDGSGGPHWWRTDLGATWPVHSIRVVGRAAIPARVIGMTVGVYTNSAATGTPVYTNAITSADQTFTLPPGREGRSVMISGTPTDGWANIAEVFVYADLSNLAAGTAATASSVYGGSWAAPNAVDRNINSVWHSSSSNGPHGWQTDLGNTYGIDTIKILARAGMPGRVSGMALTVHTNAIATGTPVFSNTVSIAGGLSHVLTMPADTDARSVRVSGTPTDGWANIAEVYVFGGAPAGEVVLDVTSLYGNPTPPTGITTFPQGSVVTAAVDSVYTNTDTIYGCTGWTNGTGSVPATGSTNEAVLTIADDSTIMWQWAPTQYLLDLTEGGGGTTDVHGGWVEAGSNVTVTAFPTDGSPIVWSGETNGCAITTTTTTNDTISWTMNEPRALAVSFPVTGLVVRYTFDDSGSVLTDSALADGVDHSLSGPSPTYDGFEAVQGAGSAVWGGAAGNWYGPPGIDDPLNRLGDGATFAFWMWADGSKTAGMMPLTWDGGGDNSPFSIYIQGGTNTTRTMQYYVGSPWIGGIPVDMDRWVHIAIAHNFVSNTARFYVNGVLSGRHLGVPDIPTSVSEHFRPGSRTGNALAYKGRLDDMQVYANQAATAGEVYYLYEHPGATLDDYNGTQPPVHPDLIARYTFDNESAIMADTGMDSVNHSMFGGAPDYDSAEKVQGTGASLWDGVSDQTYYGNINNKPGLGDPLNDLGKGVTYAYWVYPDATGPDYMMTLTWDDNNGGEGIVNRPFAMHFATGGGATRDLNYIVGAPNTIVTAPAVPMDQWSHIAVTHAFDNNTAVMYLDGIPVATNASMNDIAVSTTDYFRLGNRGGSYRFKGRLDDVQVYRDYVADSTEIEYLHGNPGGTLPVTIPRPTGMTLIVR